MAIICNVLTAVSIVICCKALECGKAGPVQAIVGS